MLVVGIAIALTLLAAPAAAFLGVPAKALLAAVVGPIQTLLFVLVLLFTPVILVGALLADLIQPLLPEGFGLGQITPPTTLFNARDAASNLPSILFYIILGSLLVFELFVLGVMVWMRHQEKRRMRALASEAFEERSIVIPPAAREQGGANRRRRDAAPTTARRSRRRVPGGAQLARARWALGTPAERDARRPCGPHPVQMEWRRGPSPAWRRPTSWSATARCHSPTASAGGRHPACERCAAGLIGPESDESAWQHP